MKLLLVSREYPPFVKGGMCRLVEHILARAPQAGIRVTLVANHPDWGLVHESIDGTPVFRVPSLGRTFLTQLPSFSFFASRLVEQLQALHDVVYSNFSPLFFSPRRPFIAGFHATRLGEATACREIGRPVQALLNRLYMPFDRGLIKRADRIVALSERMAGEIVASGGDRQRITIIPSGVDPRRFRPLTMNRNRGEVKTLLYVGRIDARKGLPILLSAFDMLRHERPLRLIIAGDGPERLRLEAVARSRGIPVSFQGHVDQSELPALYRDADLFVLPSLYEGMPLVALEAMACGTPSITSDASPDIGTPRFRRGSVQHLKAAIKTAFQSDAHLSQLSETAFQISRRYQWDRIVADTFAVIRDIASRPHPPGGSSDLNPFHR